MQAAAPRFFDPGYERKPSAAVASLTAGRGLQSIALQAAVRRGRLLLRFPIGEKLHDGGTLREYRSVVALESGHMSFWD